MVSRAWDGVEDGDSMVNKHKVLSWMGGAASVDIIIHNIMM